MEIISQLRNSNEILFWTGLLHLIASIIVGILCISNTTEVMGVNSLHKPLKFLISSWLFLFTINWYLTYIPSDATTLAYSILISVLFIFENVYITSQGFKGEMSHFNVGDKHHAFMFGLMGLAASVIAITTGMLAFKFTTTNFLQANEIMRYAIIWALVLSAIFAMEGLAMGSRLAHSVGGPDEANGVAFLNWSKRHGDLRIAHFIGIHALQIVPIASYFLAKTKTHSIMIALTYGLFAAYTFLRAFRGKALFW